MAVAQTRLLVLGAVAIFEPVNGYQIRRELLSWGVDEWAHIKPGSIYSALSTLTDNGHLERHHVRDGARDVAVYTSTEEGLAQMHSMLGDALEKVDLLAPLAFQTALCLAPLIDRAEFLGHLRTRRGAFTEIMEQASPSGSRLTVAEFAEASQETGPAHVAMIIELWARVAFAEIDWLDDVIERVESGQYAFAGEDPGWTPGDEDPGWQMVADRDRYRQLLHLD